MSIPIFGRNRPKLKALLGIRARLVLLVLILVVPLMADRVRVLEDERTQEVVKAATELSELARRTAASQREIVMAVQGFLKSAAYINTITTAQGQTCAVTHASLRSDLPWITGLSVVGPDGIIRCSTNPKAPGVNLSDREYFKNAVRSGSVVVSDYLQSRTSGRPTIISAYPVLAANNTVEAVLVTEIDLQWMSQLLAERPSRAGISVFVIDGKGTIIGAQPEYATLIGMALKDTPFFDAAVQDKIVAGGESGSVFYERTNSGKNAVSFARLAGTNARLIVDVSEASMLGNIDQKISTAYMQLALFVMLGMIGAWFVGERLIIQPINIMKSAANRFGNGDLTARAPKSGLPWEFAPLASAFNIMASRLAEREREMIATNDRLIVMASIDMVSGLANRRGLQSRLEFEWMKALQTDAGMSLMMIDVDHFKMFNDTYGHPEGDACLKRIGEALGEVADETFGYAARYGGEEFCLLLPDSDITTAMQVGEHIRKKIEQLEIAHSKSPTGTITVSVGVASLVPVESQQDDDLVEAADAALYAAKRRGRNTVVAHGLIRSTDQDVSLAS